MNGFVVLRLVVIILLACVPKFALAATTNIVQEGDFFFSPRVLTITNGDTVTWTNTAAITSHDSTSSNGVWASGLFLRTPFSFKFTSTGSFPYHCQFHQATHPEQNGTITVVAAANALPSVTITNPANNATFTAPATFTVGASASDSDGTISQVEFFRGTTSFGIDAASPYSASANNLAAGTYTISAVATDSGSGKSTNSITVIVKNPPNAVTLLSPSVDGDAFSFSFLSQSGYTYTVEYKTTLEPGSQILMTTNGTGGTVTIFDFKTDSQRFYRVGAH